MDKVVFGLAGNEDQANRIVDHLMSAGFTNDDISILSPDRNKTKVRTTDQGNVEYSDTITERKPGVHTNTSINDRTTDDKFAKKGNLTTEKHTKAPEGGVTGGVTGGILGGSLGLLAGIGALAIPGVGPFIAAGPIMAALSGTALGGTLGMLIGGLVGLGIPEYEAKKYEDGLKAGNTLISVHVKDSEEMNRAQEILRKDGAKDISSTGEKVKSNR